MYQRFVNYGDQHLIVARDVFIYDFIIELLLLFWIFIVHQLQPTSLRLLRGRNLGRASKKKKGYNYNRDKENFFPFLDDRVPFISSLAGLSFRSISPSPSPIFLFLSSTHFSDDDYCSITRRATSKKVLVKFLRPPSFPEDISPPP